MGSSPNISETLPVCAEDEWCSGFVYLAFFFWSFLLSYASSNSKPAVSLTCHNQLLLSNPVTRLDKNSSESALYFSGKLKERRGGSVWNSSLFNQ